MQDREETLGPEHIELAPWPHFDEEMVRSVEAVLRSGKVNQWTGGEVRTFEREYAEALGIGHAIAVANGTVALELALVALGIGAGDEVITSPRASIASASCAVMRGALPAFADVDPDSQNITAMAIEQAITPRTRAIVTVHLAGWPCEMDPILELAEKHGLYVVEDCAQAHGATYKGRPVGTMGHVGCFSFCQGNIITTGGEGGLAVTNDAELWSRMWSHKDHGKSYDAVFNRKWPPGFRWLHESFGTNWRLTEIQAALGRAQLRRLPDWVEARGRNAAALAEGLSPVPGLRVPVPSAHVRHAYCRFCCFVRPEHLRAGWDRDRIVAEITTRGVPCTIGVCPEVYPESALDTGMPPDSRLPVARELGATSLMLPVHPTLTERDIGRMADVVRDVVLTASG